MREKFAVKSAVSYTSFWNVLNELASPGNGTVLNHHHHDAEDEDDYTWDGMALYSACMNFRYVLTRIWDREKPLLGVIMLNPSTATEFVLDPTVTRVVTRAREIGYGGVVVMNLFAFRSTLPELLYDEKDPIGRENNRVIEMITIHCKDLLCGWGTHGAYRDRGKYVEALIRKMHITPLILDLTKDGHPVHPLYQSYKKAMRPWVKKES